MKDPMPNRKKSRLSPNPPKLMNNRVVEASLIARKAFPLRGRWREAPDEVLPFAVYTCCAAQSKKGRRRDVLLNRLSCHSEIAQPSKNLKILRFARDDSMRVYASTIAEISASVAESASSCVRS